MFLIQKVEELIVTYDDGRKNIGEFILKHIDTIHTYSIQEIASQTYTSKASIVRFAKTLGYEGWKDLKMDLIHEAQAEKEMADVDFNYPFTQGDSMKEIADKIARLHIKTIEDTLEHLDLDMAVRCTNLLVRARRIVIFGISPNTGVAELFRRKMLSIGKVVEISNPREMGIEAMALDTRDVAILVSYSGNNSSVEPISILVHLHKNNVPIIGITSGGDNLLREHTDTILTMCSRERLYTKISTFSTEESLGYLFNVLFSGVFERQYEKNDQYRQHSSRLLEQGRLKNTELKE